LTGGDTFHGKGKLSYISMERRFPGSSNGARVSLSKRRRTSWVF
jgi:hypothetical protein